MAEEAALRVQSYFRGYLSRGLYGALRRGAKAAAQEKARMAKAAAEAMKLAEEEQVRKEQEAANLLAQKLAAAEAERQRR